MQLANALDGFSIFPRITVPLVGDDPDTETFTSSNVFLVTLKPDENRGQVIPIDQRIIDNANIGSPRLIFAPDEYLGEKSTYAIVVTNGLTGGGLPYAPSATFQNFLNRYQLPAAPTGSYDAILYYAMDVLTSDLGMAPADIVTLSVFTTRTVSDVPVKLLQHLDNGNFTVTPAQFDVDDQPGIEHFPLSDIYMINSLVHRSSNISDGSTLISFPPNTLRVQTSQLQVGVDTDNLVLLQNIRSDVSIGVPLANIDVDTGAIVDLDISSLEPEVGDELAVLVRLRRSFPGYRPFQWNAIGSIAFGSIDVPMYIGADGLIAPIPSAPEVLPPQTGTEKVVFALFLPPKPEEGDSPPAPWPVVHMLHGGVETTSSLLSSNVLTVAPIFAKRGLATVSFSASEFEGGPRSYIEILTRDNRVVIKRTGRAIDIDNDGIYQATEQYTYPQRISDLSTVIRSLQMGVDLDNDGSNDIATTAGETYVAGVSFGGATAFISAAVENNASVFVANVPSSEGSRARAAGFHPLVAPRARSFAEVQLARRKPSLINAPSPEWGGAFNEDIPLKRRDVQVGLAPGAEAIQRAFDFNMWRDLESMPLAFAKHTGSGDLRSSPAKLLVQLSRGDGAAINPVQAMMVRSGGLQDRTSILLPDNEPLFDEQWRKIITPELARHIYFTLPYRSLAPSLEVAGRISHLSRIQVADYLLSQGNEVIDIDGPDGRFAGDIFQFPIDDVILEAMIADPGLPSEPEPEPDPES
ncbi:MAG: hypothetical protein H6985_19515 [Pseudomonadales bacterium]|nr:hypothetical protein [Halioglobus sp.]MCP5131760.1 hypothetical protein [Pseudomonadales bacterium]